MSKTDKLVEIHNAVNELEARIFGDILEKNGVPYLLRPRIPIPSAYSPMYLHGAVQVVVPEKYEQQARELLMSENDG